MHIKGHFFEVTTLILPRTKVVPWGRTLPAMESAAASPFLDIPEAEWVCANDLSFAIFDSYPVSPGHVLVITRRVVPTFFECTAAEQQALMALVGEVKALLDERLQPPFSSRPTPCFSLVNDKRLCFSLWS